MRKVGASGPAGFYDATAPECSPGLMNGSCHWNIGGIEHITKFQIIANFICSVALAKLGPMGRQYKYEIYKYAKLQRVHVFSSLSPACLESSPSFTGQD